MPINKCHKSTRTLKSGSGARLSHRLYSWNLGQLLFWPIWCNQSVSGCKQIALRRLELRRRRHSCTEHGDKTGHDLWAAVIDFYCSMAAAAQSRRLSGADSIRWLRRVRPCVTLVVSFWLVAFCWWLFVDSLRLQNCHYCSCTCRVQLLLSCVQLPLYPASLSSVDRWPLLTLRSFDWRQQISVIAIAIPVCSVRMHNKVGWIPKHFMCCSRVIKITR